MDTALQVVKQRALLVVAARGHMVALVILRILLRPILLHPFRQPQQALAAEAVGADRAVVPNRAGQGALQVSFTQRKKCGH
jgi:hypothetical protein